jgi:hypothetical protein
MIYQCMFRCTSAQVAMTFESERLANQHRQCSRLGRRTCRSRAAAVPSVQVQRSSVGWSGFSSTALAFEQETPCVCVCNAPVSTRVVPVNVSRTGLRQRRALSCSRRYNRSTLFERNWRRSCFPFQGRLWLWLVAATVVGSGGGVLVVELRHVASVRRWHLPSAPFLAKRSGNCSRPCTVCVCCCSVMPVQVNTSIEILAPASVIWDILCDFERYPEWNALFSNIRGELALGATLTVELESGWRGRRFRSKLTQLRTGNELTWERKLVFGWVFRGRHSFRIEPTTNGCLFTHTASFSGVTADVFPSGRFRKRLLRDFEAFNHGLKSRAEQMARTDVPSPPAAE